MAEPTVNQKAKPSGLSAIQKHMATVTFYQSSMQTRSYIAKSNDLSCVDSMIHTVVEFFMCPVPATVNIPKRTQLPASSTWKLIRSIWLPGNRPVVTFVIREAAMESPDCHKA